MAELVDALVLGTSVFDVRVRVSPLAPYSILNQLSTEVIKQVSVEAGEGLERKLKIQIPTEPVYMQV